MCPAYSMEMVKASAQVAVLGGEISRYKNITRLLISHFAAGYVDITSEAYPGVPDRLVIEHLEVDSSDSMIGGPKQEGFLDFRIKSDREVPVKIYTAGAQLEELTVHTYEKTNIRLSAVVAKRLSCITDGGEILAQGLTRGNVTFRTVNGRIYVTNIGTYNGSITGDAIHGSIDARGQNSGKFFSRPKDATADTMHASSSYGDVYFKE